MSESNYRKLHARMVREKAERDAEALGPDECRRLLAEWAAQPGRTQAEINQFNEVFAQTGRGTYVADDDENEGFR